MTFTFHFHALEKEVATHSSVLAWRIPEMGETGGLWSMGSHRVGHDWSDVAAAGDCKCVGFHACCVLLEGFESDVSLEPWLTVLYPVTHLTNVNLTKSEYPHSAFREFPPWGGGGGKEPSQLTHYYNAVSPVLWQKYTNSAESKKWALNKISRRYQNQGRCLKGWLDSKEKNKWTEA